VTAARRRCEDGSLLVHLRTCPLCEAKCGLEIHVDGERRPIRHLVDVRIDDPRYAIEVLRELG